MIGSLTLLALRPLRTLNFVVVGGGPTGVELAGTLAEIARHALAHEFRSIDPARTHILLIEGGPRILPAYAEDLSGKAQEQLHQLGVEVRTSTTVTQIEPGAVMAGDTRLPATVILWASVSLHRSIALDVFWCSPT